MKHILALKAVLHDLRPLCVIRIGLQVYAFLALKVRNNIAQGKALGSDLQRFKPCKGVIIIDSGFYSPLHS